MSGRINLPGYGSSPRVRGTVFFGDGGQGGDRFIPAGAGNGVKEFTIS